MEKTERKWGGEPHWVVGRKNTKIMTYTESVVIVACVIHNQVNTEAIQLFGQYGLERRLRGSKLNF